jgi:hypothetical protein
MPDVANITGFEILAVETGFPAFADVAIADADDPDSRYLREDSIVPNYKNWYKNRILTDSKCAFRVSLEVGGWRVEGGELPGTTGY